MPLRNHSIEGTARIPISDGHATSPARQPSPDLPRPVPTLDSPNTFRTGTMRVSCGENHAATPTHHPSPGPSRLPTLTPDSSISFDTPTYGTTRGVVSSHQRNRCGVLSFQHQTLSNPRTQPPLPPIEPNWLSIDEINDMLGDLRSTLLEWTGSWGPVSYWSVRMNPSLPYDEVADFRRDAIKYVEYTKSKLHGLHRLAMVDFETTNHTEIRKAWREALHLAEEVQYRVSVADAILSD
jgi:hypothetical protein